MRTSNPTFEAPVAGDQVVQKSGLVFVSVPAFEANQEIGDPGRCPTLSASAPDPGSQVAVQSLDRLHIRTVGAHATQ